jgi:ABC-2 type transport system ATP-binding protein
MSEMAQTAEHLIVIGKGRLIADQPIADILQSAGRPSVLVRTPKAAELSNVLGSSEVSVSSSVTGELEVTGLTAEEVGDAAFKAAIPIHQLVSKQASLEEAFMELTGSTVEFHGGRTAAGTEAA